MSIFQFKLSSLCKEGSNYEANEDFEERNAVNFSSKSSCDSKSTSPSPVLSVFELNERELWNSDNESDIFEDITPKNKNKGKEEEKEKESEKEKEKEDFISSPQEIQNSSFICKEIDYYEISDGSETVSDIEILEKERKAEIISELSPGEICCFDIDFDQDFSPEHIRTVKSPVFDVSHKSQSTINRHSIENEEVIKQELSKTESFTSEINLKNSTSLKNDKLKPLNINKETNLWLAKILENEAFLNITSDMSEQKLQKNLAFLNKSYLEILEKGMTALENLPVEILKNFPEFDPDVFTILRITRRRIKAVIIKTENLLKKRCSLESPNNNQSISEMGMNNQGKAFCLENNPESISSSFNESHNLDIEPIPIKSVNPTISFRQSLVPLNESVVDLGEKNSSTNMNTSSNQDIIDYTDRLYKSPVKANERFQSNMRNDATSKEFDGANFPHSKELLKTFHQKFGLRSFRTNQLQVINAALLGHDCFVLMPTGGGKSLCYQLPALITKGVTVVISPLRSLILDQVTKLLTLDIAAGHLSGDISEKEADAVYRKLNKPEPDLKLLYVTPEKVGSSYNLRNCFLGLYKRNMLARFVIDEAHCVSQWGHDFRPDYKKLRELRENYPNVSIMALTATATPRVRIDILHQLKVDKPKWFLSSFNRSNLTYSVKEKKGKSTLKDIASIIQKDFAKDTGIIYCFSRKECEDVAQELKIYGITAISYHAGLNDKERAHAQNSWMNGRVKVVCATIAFGMGIDKLDVRFVIHYSLPKSIEGYYQESGRAGRDGDKSTCILYYSYKDKHRILKLINMDQSVQTQAARKVHVDNLFRVVAFAENVTDCRRVLQLEYFGEKFDRKNCMENKLTACDNCLQQGLYETIDVTSESKAIVKAVKDICGPDYQKRPNFTMLHFVDIFRGTGMKKLEFEGHHNLPLCGMGKSWQRLDVERLMRKLIMEEFLKERIMVKEEGMTCAYLKFGRRGGELLEGKVKIMFEIKKRKGTNAAQSNTDKFEVQVDPAILEIQEKCYSELTDVIRGIATSLNCNPNAIMNVQALRAMSSSLPEKPEQMLAINHVTMANFEKYGNILLEITKRYADEKKVIATEVLEKDLFADEPRSSDTKIEESPYFDPEVTFVGRERGGGGERGKKRKKNYARKWQNSKKWKGSSNSSNSAGSFKSKGASKSRGGGKTGTKTAVVGTGVTTIPGSHFSKLMELPTNKSRGFSRPKAVLKNL